MTDKEDACYGPTLPPSFSRRDNSDSVDEDSSQENSFGPALPPHLSKSSKVESDAAFGPALPPKPTVSKSEESGSRNNAILGPALPPGFQREPIDSDEDSSNDAACFGPLPPDQISATSLALEERALEMKLAKLAGNDKEDLTEQREEWMLVPPEIMIQAGVAKTQFSKSKCERNRDQSSWTETPHDKQQKAEGRINKKDQKRKLQEEAERSSARKRDAEQEAIVKKHKKDHKRDKSLLDLHSEKRKKEKESKSSDQVRRPFNRETDLQLNKFDSRQVKSVIDKAKILDSRFSAGSNKYL
ncbi:unnamed protein product [Hermetia illucens]|uniref:DUF3752 domain-containing protein n=1 Tax=Hermetia illucens TaxID=343691 RepID=A0A7R8UP47_HERIL|nr:GPALPP motifs-containing protein 1 [Hermetia illucens]CAD7084438.1 unnamed protein product [Hermetia illucens]